MPNCKECHQPLPSISDNAWCFWCDRPRNDCACHLDPNGIPAGHWSLPQQETSIARLKHTMRQQAEREARETASEQRREQQELHRKLSYSVIREALRKEGRA